MANVKRLQNAPNNRLADKCDQELIIMQNTKYNMTTSDGKVIQDVMDAEGKTQKATSFDFQKKLFIFKFHLISEL